MKRLSFLLLALPVAAVSEPAPIDQNTLNQMIIEGRASEAFLEAFLAGDELTEFSFGADRGVGANIGEGRRFTRIPRADLAGPTDWANHFPTREGGANATSCIACHNTPFANGAGDVAVNVVVDPAHTGDPSKYLERNTLPLFALGIPQRLAEEISQELYAQRDSARDLACTEGEVTVDLTAKGVDYGSLVMSRKDHEICVVEIDSSGLKGIDADLVIKPFGWKGNHATIRAFTRDAAHNELGMQAVELVGDQDGDFDGIINEFSVGDMTALTVYMAGLERPVSTLELSALDLMEIDPEQQAEILAGEAAFSEIGCASCHVPSMQIDEAMFREPSIVKGFYDETFPDGSDPETHGLTRAVSISFDMTKDQPNNLIALENGTSYHLGAIEPRANGAGLARWFTDFKRHDMGPELADPDDPLGLGASMFLTRSLAGVGATGPWLHDGRATSLSEAITSHGGDAAQSAAAFEELPEDERAQVIAFLESLVIYHDESEAEP